MNPWAAFIGGLLLAGIVAGSVGYEMGADSEGALARRLPTHLQPGGAGTKEGRRKRRAS